MESNVPPVYSPPPHWNPVPPRPPRGSRGWKLLALFLALIVIFLVMGDVLRAVGNLALGSRPGPQSGRWLDQIMVEDNGSENQIAIIDVEGIITSQSWDRSGRNMVDFIEDQLKLAAENPAIKAVILKVDSPGGEVMASDDISRAIVDFQEKHGKPVVAAMGGMAASGGYYVSAPCRWIVANELTMTGSIGVIMHSFNYRALMDKVGLYPMVFKSGKFKDMLSGSKKIEEIDPEEQRMIQTMIDETYKKFLSVVRAGRQKAKERNQTEGRALVDNWEQYADGRVLTGSQAYEHGFVDEQGTFETAIERAKKLAGVPDADLIRYQEPFSILNLLGLVSAHAQEPNTVKVDLGMNFPKLQVGRLYFLSATVIH